MQGAAPIAYIATLLFFMPKNGYWRSNIP